MRKVKLIRQAADNECGLCCISMIACYFGFYQPISYYRNKFSVGRDGTSIKDMCKILDSINLKSTVYKTDDIIEMKVMTKPLIAYLNNNHFVVIRFKGKSSLLIYDSSNGKKTVSLEEFNKVFGHYIIESNKTDAFVPFKKNLNDFRHIFKILKTVKKDFFIVLFLSIIAYMISVIIPLLLKNLINDLSSSFIIDITSICMNLLFLLLGYFVFSIIRNKTLVKLQILIFEKLSKDLIHHLFRIPYSFFDNRSKGNIIFRLNLLSQFQNVISYNLVQVIIGLTSTSIIYLYFVFFQRHILIQITFIILILAGLVAYANIYLLKFKQEEIDEKSKLNSLENEIVVNMFQIKSLKHERYFEQTYDNSFNLFKVKFKNSQSKTLMLNQIIGIINIFSPLFILVWVCVVQSNNTDIGELFAIYSLLGMLLSYATSFFGELSNLVMLKASLFYINDILDEEEIIKQGLVELREFKKLQIEKLYFKYNDTSNFNLYDINLEVERNQKVSIVGLSGSGKSTLIKLLATLYNADSGYIKINDIDINEISMSSFGKILSIVPQSTILFNKTIKDNITLESSEYTDKDIWRVLKIVNLESDVINMPMQLSTILSDQGGSLSGGQIQRLSIARAILKNPDFLILDESTSSLDAENESIIYNNLRNENITLLTISHRLSTIMDSDKIYVFENGKIIGCGTHKFLLNNCNRYYDLFIKQQNENKVNEKEIK